MSEELNLVRDLAVILISAGVMTVISRALNQPLVLGYIIAGLLVGPHVDFFPGIEDTHTVEQWSEIGIIFMMFGLGLEFSFKKLMKVGAGAAVTAASKFIGLFIFGYLIAQAMSWTTMESIFLASLLSMSSTAVIIKSFDDMGLKNKPYAQLSFGAIVIEDLVAIMLMVVLSSIAVSNGFAGKELLFNLGKLAFFLILWFLVGIYLIPTLLKKASKFLSDEILIVVSIGLCFAMVAFALSVGFSAALGAFVMGSILAETVQSTKIEKVVGPIKDLFGAVFFVSVGMMLEPAMIAQHWLTILILCLVVLIGGAIAVTTGVLLAGKGFENAVHTGFSLAQLGEFGFILAGVGVSLGVVREFIYPVVVSVSVITVFVAPYLIRASTPIYRWLRKKLPEPWLEKIDSLEKNESSSKAEQSEWKKLLRAYVSRIVFYGVLVIAVDLCVEKYLGPFLRNLFPAWSDGLHTGVLLGLTMVAIAPFIYGLGVTTGTINDSAAKLLKEKRSNRWSILGLVLLRTIISASLVLAIISKQVELEAWTILLVLSTVVVLILLSRRFLRNFNNMEQQFFANYNQKEELQRSRTPVSSAMKEKLAGYNVQLEAMIVPAESSYVGTRLRNLSLRSETGANILKIQRGENSYFIPSGDLRLYPNDRILAVGTNEQLASLKAYLEDSRVIKDSQAADSEGFKVERISIEEGSYLLGKTLRSSNLSEFKCVVVSVLREESFITNPKPDFVFALGDVVWIAGEVSSCDWLK